jgi:replicative DNA helicase
MKRVIRSLIDITSGGKATVSKEELLRNFNTSSQWKFNPPDARDMTLLAFVLEHFYQYAEAPAWEYVKQYFERGGQPDIVDLLDHMLEHPALIGSNYEAVCREVFRVQNERIGVLTLKEAATIMAQGLDVFEGKKKVHKKGMADAMSYLYDRMSTLTTSESGVKLSGDSVVDAPDVVKDYYMAKADPTRGIGRLSGLEEIDLVCKGGKPGELWTHAAFTGELKTTLALNMSYRNAVKLRYNVLYLSLEVPKRQLDRQVFVMHSGHPKFREAGYETIDYRKLRDGQLSAQEEAVMHQVEQDLVDGAARGEYGMHWVERPAAEMSVTDIQRLAEFKHRTSPLGMIIIDRADLVLSRFNVSNMTTAQNWVFKDLKQLAMNFNHGEGIFVLLLAQMNREGHEYANEHNGQYRLKDIAYANEAEKSSDVVTYTYLHEYMRGSDATTHFVCGCLKNRDNPIFDQFTGYVDYGTKTMMSMAVSSTMDANFLSDGVSKMSKRQS